MGFMNHLIQHAIRKLLNESNTWAFFWSRLDILYEYLKQVWYEDRALNFDTIYTVIEI